MSPAKKCLFVAGALIVFAVLHDSKDLAVAGVILSLVSAALPYDWRN